MHHLEFRGLSEAAIIHSLAVRGAETLLGEPGDVRRALLKAGASLNTVDLLAASGEVRTRSEATSAISASEALGWARGER